MRRVIQLSIDIAIPEDYDYKGNMFKLFDIINNWHEDAEVFGTDVSDITEPYKNMGVEL